MATFHRMTDESGKDVIRAFVKGAPDQLLDRSSTVLDVAGKPVPSAGVQERFLEENSSSARVACGSCPSRGGTSTRRRSTRRATCCR